MDRGTKNLRQTLVHVFLATSIIISPSLSVAACEYGTAKTRTTIQGQEITLGFDFSRPWQNCSISFQCTITAPNNFFNEQIDQFNETLTQPDDEFIITIPDDIDPAEVITTCQLDRPEPSQDHAPQQQRKTHGEINIKADRYGNYQTNGTINGRKVSFIVDTGANLVFLSQKTAKRLRLKYSKTRPIKIQTASGQDRAYLTSIDEIALGTITLHDVRAAISTHAYPQYPLLGMSALRQLELHHKDGEIVLKQSP